MVGDRAKQGTANGSAGTANRRRGGLRRRLPGGLALAVAVLALGAVAAPGPARAGELVTNGSFDHDLSSWKYANVPGYGVAWSSEDAEGSPSSGSAALSNSNSPAGYSAVLVSQCVPVEEGTTYRAAAKLLLPDGQDRTGRIAALLLWWGSEDCTNSSISSDFIGLDDTPGDWVEYQIEAMAPPGAKGVEVRAGVDKVEAAGALSGNLDDVSVMPTGEAPPPDECGTVPGPDITDGDFPDYRFRVEIVNGAGALSATPESQCLAETLCVSGALPGRTEAELRLIGPRPNGYLWMEVVRFTPAELRIEVERPSDGTCRMYDLDAIPPGSDTLDGFVDRTAFVP